MDLKVNDERAKESGVVLEVLHRPPLYVRSPVEQLAFDLLADRAAMLARIAELEAEVYRLEEYACCTSDCALSFFEQYDPERGYKYSGEWTKEPPKCTCGLQKE